MTSKFQKYGNATLKNLTEEELKRAHENYNYARMRFPDEFALSESIIKAKGLTGHREIHEFYLNHKVPISGSEIAVIGLYADSTYAGPFGRGEAHGAPTTAGGTKEDAIFRPTVKPGEA